MNVTFCEQEEVANEFGGTMRVTNGQEWADFYHEADADKFADFQDSVARSQNGLYYLTKNANAFLSCKVVETIVGIATIPKWKPLIDAYCKWDAMQCGYCTPGFLVTAKALLDRNPNPTIQEINEALAGNICTCGTYPRHAQAIREAVAAMAEGRDAQCLI